MVGGRPQAQPQPLRYLHGASIALWFAKWCGLVEESQISASVGYICFFFNLTEMTISIDDTSAIYFSSQSPKNMATRLIASSLGLLLSVVTAAPTNGTDAFQQRCLSFQPETHISNSTRTVREFVTAGTNLSFPDNDATCIRASQLVSADMCRIALSIPTSERSSITYEMWLPRTWSGRFLATGNGGVDGCKTPSPLGNDVLTRSRHQV